MSTYLQLCQDMARDIGIPGTGPSSVTSTTLSEEENSVVRYIKQANNDLQSRWFDWDFLWKEGSISSAAGTSTLVTPADLGNWKLDEIIWDKATDNYQELEYVVWDQYNLQYKLGSIAAGAPEVFSVKPDNQIDMYPTPDSITKVNVTYWTTPTELTADSSVSAIPVRFHKIIIARAKMYYAENEDAPEIMAGSLNEFEDLLDKLEADQLPRQKNRRFSRAQDLSNFTVTPE